MQTFINLVAGLVLIAPTLAQAQDAAPEPDKNYESSVWARLSPVASGFTAAKAAESARTSSPEVNVAEAEVQVAIAQTRQTLSRYVPNLAVSGTISRRNRTEINFGSGATVAAANDGLLTVGACPGGAGNNCVLDGGGQPVGAFTAPPFITPQNAYSIDASLSVPFSDYVLALSPARKGARENEKAARLRKEAQLQTADVNARIAYFDWVRAQAQLAVAEASLASSKARVEDARIGVDAGTVTTADSLGIENLSTSAELNVVQAKSFLRLAEQNLRITAQYVGPLQIGEDLSKEPVDIESLGTLDELIEHGKKNRAESKALEKSESAVKLGIDGANANLYPRLDGIVNVTHANPNQQFFPATQEWNTSWMIGLSLSWSVSGYLNTKAQVRELGASANMMRAQSSSLERGIELEIRSAWEEWQRAVATATLAANELAAAEAMHEQRILLFQGGEATSTAVAEAEIQRANATYRKISAGIDKRVALARMRRAAALDAKVGGK